MNQLLNPEITKCQYETEAGTRCLICDGNADPETYNDHVTKAITEAFSGRSLVLKTKGRTSDEKGIVWIENGKIKGTGYASEIESISDLSEIKSHLSYYYDTQDAQSIIRGFIEKGKVIGHFQGNIPVVEIS